MFYNCDRLICFLLYILCIALFSKFLFEVFCANLLLSVTVSIFISTSVFCRIVMNHGNAQYYKQ